MRRPSPSPSAGDCCAWRACRPLRHSYGWRRARPEAGRVPVRPRVTSRRPARSALAAPRSPVEHGMLDGCGRSHCARQHVTSRRDLQSRQIPHRMLSRCWAARPRTRPLAYRIRKTEPHHVRTPHAVGLVQRRSSTSGDDRSLGRRRPAPLSVTARVLQQDGASRRSRRVAPGGARDRDLAFGRLPSGRDACIARHQLADRKRSRARSAGHGDQPAARRSTELSRRALARRARLARW